jgi:hypothetical protein
MLSTLFVLVILEMGSHFLPKAARTATLLYMLPIAGMTGVHHHIRLLIFLFT